jgi:hypothetical protein
MRNSGYRARRATQVTARRATPVAAHGEQVQLPSTASNSSCPRRRATPLGRGWRATRVAVRGGGDSRCGPGGATPVAGAWRGNSSYRARRSNSSCRPTTTAVAKSRNNRAELGPGPSCAELRLKSRNLALVLVALARWRTAHGARRKNGREVPYYRTSRLSLDAASRTVRVTALRFWPRRSASGRGAPLLAATFRFWPRCSALGGDALLRPRRSAQAATLRFWRRCSEQHARPDSAFPSRRNSGCHAARLQEVRRRPF